MRRSDKYRLYPTRSQAVALNAMLGAFCELYNAGLQQRIEAYQRQRKSLRYLDQANELKAVRLADDRLAGYSYSTEQQILRRLDKAFAGFFRRLKTKAKAGFPRFRAKSWFDRLNGMLGAFCDIYNAGLQQRIEAYQRQRRVSGRRQPEGAPEQAHRDRRHPRRDQSD